MLHTLKKKNPNKKPKPRIGRGGKRGTYSGRGIKGQKSRAGHRIRPADRDFFQRLPKLRGHKNTKRAQSVTAINVSDLEKYAKDGKPLNAKSFKGPVKILGRGEIAKSVTIIGVPVSASAQQKIEQAGGKVVNS